MLGLNHDSHLILPSICPATYVNSVGGRKSKGLQCLLTIALDQRGITKEDRQDTVAKSDHLYAVPRWYNFVCLQYLEMNYMAILNYCKLRKMCAC